MNWIEIIQLKPFTGTDRDHAMAAFRQLTPPRIAIGLRDIKLFQSLNLENELSILIDWQGETPQGGKSRLGLQLATTFSEFGHIYHSGWKHNLNLNLKTWRMINEQQVAV